METSMTSHSGQTPSCCQYCENEQSVIRYKCIECGILLCEGCKNNHHKTKFTKNHTIIDIKDVGTITQSIDLENIPCTHHTGQTACMYCRTCDTLVCPSCIAKTHKKHDLIEIKEAYEWKKESLLQKSEHTDKTLEALRAKDHFFKDVRGKKDRNIEKARQGILDHEKVQKRQVEKHAKALLQELDTIETNVEKEIKADEKLLSKCPSEIETITKDKDLLISTSNGTEFFKKINGLIQSYDQTPIPKTRSEYNTEIKFIPRGLDSIGELETGKVKGRAPEVFELTNVKKYTVGLKHVSCIIPIQADNHLIYSAEDKVLQNIQLTGDTVKVIAAIECIVIFGMASFNDNILLSTMSGIQLYDIKTSKIKVSRFDVSPLLPCNPHITKDNRLIVGAVNADYPKPGRRVLVIMNERGDREATFERDGNNRPIFAGPARTTTTANGYIHVSDWDDVNESEGRVIVLDQKGRVITRFRGHSKVNSEIPFCPEGIVTLPNDTVAVADLETHHLYILNDCGELLTRCYTAEKGILLPKSLTVCDSKYLYIGCARNIKNKKTLGKLYKTTIC